MISNILGILRLDSVIEEPFHLMLNDHWKFFLVQPNSLGIKINYMDPILNITDFKGATMKTKK